MRHQHHTTLTHLALAFALLLGLTSPVYAVDGVIEINQAKALAGGVTTGDTPGFPVTISESGSYRLTGNLTMMNTIAIQITTDDVTLDLNGFAISGSDRGVVAFDGLVFRSNITVMNGTVRDMLSDGIRLGPNARVERVRVLNNGGNGIEVDTGSTVSGSTASSNRDIGIRVRSGSTVSGNTASGNSDGIVAGGDSTVSGNTASSNDRNGIIASSGSIVSGNTASSNGSLGLFLGNTTGYATNVLTDNNGGNVNQQVFGGIQIGINLCGTNTTCL